MVYGLRSAAACLLGLSNSKSIFSFQPPLLNCRDSGFLLFNRKDKDKTLIYAQHCNQSYILLH